ncbi:MAG: hypothetical protein OHK0037_26960 [Elainellaceae cyanobacterium]
MRLTLNLSDGGSRSQEPSATPVGYSTRESISDDARLEGADPSVAVWQTIDPRFMDGSSTA